LQEKGLIVASIIKADTLQSTTANVFVLNSAGTEYARFNSTGNFQLVNPTTFPAGTVSLPSITATGDTNTGLYFPAADTIGFVEGGVEAMRIDSSGNVLVGKTALPSASVFGFAVNASSNNFQYLMNSINTTGSGTHFEFYNPNGKVGSITTSGSATSYVTSSDYRLKEDISPMTGALAKVALLKPVTYKWKADGSDGQGFIAHELQEVVEGCVVGEKDAVDAEGNPRYQGIDTSFLVATLTAAIQEQQALITQLQADVAALKGA